MEHHSRPLNLCHVNLKSLIINRGHMLIHGTALLILIHYRASFFFTEEANSPDQPSTLAWLIIFLGELTLSLTWLLHQAFRWQPVSRTAFPERLPSDEELPSVDVLVCTADPDKEPTVGVMNTVISAMSLDYPPEKLHVYLSDDGGSPLTQHAMREAFEFARRWLPFCKRYGVKTRCPKAYFMDEEEVSTSVGYEYESEKQELKEKYESFEADVNGYRNRHYRGSRAGMLDHPSTIKVFDGLGNADRYQMPRLVYVSREKRPSHPHNFKAGALNVLLRVSGVISNSPYILVLDCDMYCKDPSSARRAMCFHLDPKISPSLSFVQFPQMFHNISENDIYDSKIRSPFGTLWYGMDGLQGPLLSGTGFYIKRGSLYCKSMQEGIPTDLMDLKAIFGHSNEFIKHLQRSDKLNKKLVGDLDIAYGETELLASCRYENGTKWGQEVGFRYGSVAEDFFTSLTLHCKGWESVYCYPSRPQFLGASTTNLNDLLVQNMRWSSGLAEVGFSRFSPPIYAPWRMSILQSMCYTELAFFPLYCLPLCCFATIPQICLFNGISIFPEVWSSLFFVYCFVFVSSLCKHLYEVIESGHSVRTFINEQRIWMILSVTSYLYGSINAVLTKTGVRRASFFPTNKVADDEQSERYEKGVFDFRTSMMFLVPIVALVMLNMASFVGGIARALVLGGWDTLFAQIALSFFVLMMGYPVIEGMVRTDNGRIPLSATMWSALLCLALLLLCSALLNH